MLKSIAAPVAIAGFFVTFAVGVLQLEQASGTREDERFDKAISRLAGSNATERLPGLAGLQLFLDSDYKSCHRATLEFLANALAVEGDDTVRNAILTVLARLKPGQIDHPDLTYVVEKLRDETRNILEEQQTVSLAT